MCQKDTQIFKKVLSKSTVCYETMSRETFSPHPGMDQLHVMNRIYFNLCTIIADYGNNIKILQVKRNEKLRVTCKY